MAYSAGMLAEGLSLVLASHLSFCRACRGTVAGGEALGGALLDELAPAALDAGARHHILARLGGSGPVAARAAAPAPDRRVPAPLARYLAVGLESVEWQIFTPGIRQHRLLPDDPATGASLRLLRGAPRARLPRHGHAGTELTLVLVGSFHDALGQFGPGDVAECDNDTVHQPVIDPGEPCLCVLASDAAFLPTGPWTRLLQRWFLPAGPARHGRALRRSL